MAQGAFTAGPGFSNVDRTTTAVGTRIGPVISLGRHFNMPHAVNKTLFLGGNGAHEIWNISNPSAPVRMSELLSPNRFGEAESHQLSFSAFPDGTLHAATISGKGIDIWNVSNPSAPTLEKAVLLPGVNYGDFTAAVWGVYFQGKYIYVGGTNTGLHVIDATVPSSATLVKTVPTSALGGISAGPLFALGNLLVITTPKESSGVVTMDISDPVNPVLLDFVDPVEKSYSGSFYGKNAHMVTPFRSYDVTTDPSNITLVGSASTPASEYMTFGEGPTLYLGTLRTSAGGLSGILKYSNVTNWGTLPSYTHFVGRSDSGTDDQFPLPIGNLLVIADDERLYGAQLALHKQSRDSTAPTVIYVNPPDGATNQRTSTRIGISFSDQIELTSATNTSFVVRPVGGTAVSGRWGVYHTTLTFSPDQPLAAGTTYEVVLPAGGVKDLVGNGIASQFRSTFTTAGGTSAAPTCGINPTTSVTVGTSTTLSAANADTTKYAYSWTFGDNTTGNGASVGKSWSIPNRYSVRLTVRDIVTGAIPTEHYEAESATLLGGVTAANNQAGYSGSGFADFPSTSGSGVKVSFVVTADQDGAHDLQFRYGNGDSTGARSLKLVVNGSFVRNLDFTANGNWSGWQNLTASAVNLRSGSNTVDLVADLAEAGPNIDKLSIPQVRSATCSAFQVVHRPLTASVPTRTNTLAKAGSDIWTVNPDSNTVTAVNATTFAKVREVAVGTHPRTLAERPGATEELWVVNQDSHNIKVLNPATGATIATLALPYGSQPYGVVFDPAGNNAYVTLQGLGRLLKFNASTRTQSGSLDLGPDASGVVPAVRGIAVNHDGTRVFVTRFISPNAGGEVYEVSASTMTKVRTITLGNSTRPDDGNQGRGIPNYLTSIAISPDNVKMFVPSKQDNMSRGTFRDGKALSFDTTVRPIVSRIDLGSNAEDASARVDLNDADMPVTNWVSSKGDLVFVALQGNNSVHVMNAYTGEVVGGFVTGRAPQGLWHESGKLFVQNFMDRSLSVFDISGIVNGTSSTASELATVDTVTTELLGAQVLQGKKLFYNADDARMSKDGYISCASCHTDGVDDGRVWDFTDRGEGLRNTVSLHGRSGTAMGPVHWTGNFDEIQDFENDIRNGFGGSGFMSNADFTATTDPLGTPKAGRSADLDALAAYVASLTSVPKSPFRNADGSLGTNAAAGKTIYQGRDCGTCHGGPRFTDSSLNVFHNVGTISSGSGKRRGQTLTGFDTPSLLGAWATAPYFHDGSAPDLYAVINKTGHGNAQSLTAADKDKLVAYLKSIDEAEAGSGPSTTRTALLVVGDPTLRDDDLNVKTRLEGLGYSVVAKDDGAVSSGDIAGKSLVVIAESSGGTVLAPRVQSIGLHTTSVPVICLDGAFWDELYMANNGTAATSQTTMAILDGSHALAADLSGTVTVASAGSNLDYATTFGTGVKKVASVSSQSTQVVYFAYEAGAAMVTGTAPARRVGLTLHDSLVSLNANENAWLMLDAAVRWAAGEAVGLVGAYYDAMDFSSWKANRTDAQVDFNWSGGPITGVGSDTFSVRWTGEVMPPTSGTYTFHTRTDDGARLRVNGVLLVDKWVNQGATEWSGTISLSAGQRYSIQLEYYDNTGGAVAQLSWSGPGVAKRVIPKERLLP